MSILDLTFQRLMPTLELGKVRLHGHQPRASLC